MHLSRRPWLPVTRFCIPALSVALLSACGGSGSGDAPAVQAPVTGPDANLLMPIDTGVTYQYLNPLSPENDPETFDITYGAAIDFIGTSVNPLSFTIQVPIEDAGAMNVKEMITSNTDEIILYGYSLEDLPLGIVGLDTEEPINMSIEPDVGAAIYTTDMELGADPQALGFSSATITLGALTNEQIATMFLEFVPSLPFPITEQNVIDGIVAFDLAGKGVPVSVSGTTQYKQTMDAADTAWGELNNIASGSLTAHEIVFTMRLTIGSAAFVGINVFSMDIDVVSTMQFIPGLGPISRQFVVTQGEIIDVGFSALLNAVTAGDDNGDYWLDSLGPKPAE